MQVRQAQISAMQVEREAQYVRSLAQDLRASAPQATAALDGPTLLQAVRTAFVKAQGHGLKSGPGTGAFVALAVLMHPNFDQVPAVQAFLRRPEITMDFKLEFLAKLLADHLRARVA